MPASTGEKTTTDTVVLLVEDDRDAARQHADWLREEFTVELVTGSDFLNDHHSVPQEALLRVITDAPSTPRSKRPRETETHHPLGLITAEEHRRPDTGRRVDGHLVRPVDKWELREFVGRLWRRFTYRTLLREEFSVVSEIGSKTTTTPDTDPLTHDEYQRLLDRKHTIRTQIRAIERQFDFSDFTALIKREFGTADTAVAT